MVKELQEKTFPSILGCFEKQASKSGAPEGWIFGKVRNSCCLLAVVVVTDFKFIQTYNSSVSQNAS